jgi:hypothetical protein
MEPADPDHPQRQLIQALVGRGIGVYRIEKPGMGDSVGTPACATSDFDTELAAFEAGYKALADRHAYRPSSIFLLGHSLGGLAAPLIASRGPAPRGVAVYGTVLRPWADYVQDVTRDQNTIRGVEDPVRSAEQAEAARPIVDAIYRDKLTPAEAARRHPQLEGFMREALGWDGGELIFGRHYSFWQDIASLPLYAAWRDARTNVLSIYGEHDVAALNSADHRMIARLVNRYRPSTGRFVQIARADHFMVTTASIEEAPPGPDSPPPRLSPELVDELAGWIERSMAEPAVEQRFAPPAQAGAGR